MDNNGEFQVMAANVDALLIRISVLWSRCPKPQKSYEPWEIPRSSRVAGTRRDLEACFVYFSLFRFLPLFSCYTQDNFDRDAGVSEQSIEKPCAIYHSHKNFCQYFS